MKLPRLIITAIGRAWGNPLQRIVLLSAVAIVVIAILLEGPPRFTNASIAPRTGSPVLDLQLVETLEQARLILGDAPSVARETMRLKTRIDFAFIAAYGVFFISVGWVLARRGGWRRIVALSGAVCGFAAGIFDVLENQAILAILDLPMSQIPQTALDAIRQASIAKWSLAGAALAFLAVAFVANRKVTVAGKT